MMAACNAQLQTFTYSPQPDFAWDPDVYKPVKDTYWIGVRYLPIDNKPISTNPIQHHSSFIYQIECYVPERHGGFEAMTLADAVSNHFFPSTNETTSLTAGSITVHINRRPDKTPLTAQVGFIGVAVLVKAFALT